MFLTKFASKVYIVHRRDTFRASKPMQQRVFDNPKIEIIWDTEVIEILANETGVTGIKVKNTKTGEETERETGGLFMGIGHTPNTGFLGGQIDIEMLSKGIYTAMTTTIVGLMVGIIAYISYNYLVSKITQAVYKLEAVSIEFLDLIYDKKSN